MVFSEPAKEFGSLCSDGRAPSPFAAGVRGQTRFRRPCPRRSSTTTDVHVRNPHYIGNAHTIVPSPRAVSFGTQPVAARGAGSATRRNSARGRTSDLASAGTAAQTRSEGRASFQSPFQKTVHLCPLLPEPTWFAVVRETSFVHCWSIPDPGSAWSWRNLLLGHRVRKEASTFTSPVRSVESIPL